MRKKRSRNWFAGLCLSAVLLCGGGSARAEDITITSLDDVIAWGQYDLETRTYSLVATNITVSGSVVLDQDGGHARSITLQAAENVAVAEGAALLANGADSGWNYPDTAGDGGTITIRAANVTIGGAVSASGGQAWQGGASGTIDISAGAITVAANGSVSSNRGRSRLTDLPATIALTAPSVNVSGTITCQKGSGGFYGAIPGGGGITLTATTSIDVLGALNTLGAMYWDGAQGGIVQVNAGSLDLSGTVNLDGGNSYTGYGHGGTLSVNADTANLRGPLSALGGYGGARGGDGGSLVVAARNLAFATSFNAAGSAAENIYTGGGGNGGTAAITADTLTLNGSMTLNGGYGGGPDGGGTGGTAEIDAWNTSLVEFLLTADGGSGAVLSRPGGTVTVRYYDITPSDEPVTKTRFVARPDGTVTFIKKCGAAPAVRMTGVTPAYLWPADSTMRDVTVSGTVLLPEGCSITSATYSIADEYGIFNAAGILTADKAGNFSLPLSLLARRNSHDADGRTYTISLSVQDEWGSAGATAVVLVPRYKP